jgi:glycosyltransferase involved in cell wall biosynthesis
VPAAGSGGGANFLCVASVTREKGHDVLLAALARITDLTWQCVFVGALTREPDFVAQFRRDVRTADLHERVVLAGPRAGGELDASYAGADVLLLASRAESYGMVVTEALARALPVLATDVGGIPEALGVGRAGRRPGLLVPVGDVSALADSLRRWLSDAELRRDLREAARQRRAELTGWSETGGRVGRVLAEVTA